MSALRALIRLLFLKFSRWELNYLSALMPAMGALLLAALFGWRHCYTAATGYELGPLTFNEITFVTSGMAMILQPVLALMAIHTSCGREIYFLDAVVLMVMLLCTVNVLCHILPVLKEWGDYEMWLLIVTKTEILIRMPHLAERDLKYILYFANSVVNSMQFPVLIATFMIIVAIVLQMIAAIRAARSGYASAPTH